MKIATSLCLMPLTQAQAVFCFLPYLNILEGLEYEKNINTILKEREKLYSCIDVYSFSCLHSFSNERKSMFKSGDSRVVILRRSGRDIVLASSVRLSVCLSIPSVRPSALFVCPEPYLSTYWSDLIYSWYK